MSFHTGWVNSGQETLATRDRGCPFYLRSGHRPHDGRSTEVRPARAQRDRRLSELRQTGRHSAAV